MLKWSGCGHAAVVSYGSVTWTWGIIVMSNFLKSQNEDIKENFSTV